MIKRHVINIILFDALSLLVMKKTIQTPTRTQKKRNFTDDFYKTWHLSKVTKLFQN